MRRSSTLVILGLLAIVPGCSREDSKPAALPSSSTVAEQSPADLAAVLATIDGQPITVEDFQRQINHQSPYMRPRYKSLEKKKEFLQTMIRFEILAAEALKRGYDKDPDVVRAMKQVMIQKLVEKELDTQVDPTAIPEEELRAFFDKHKDQYNRPDEVRVSAIVLADKATADKVAALARGKAGATYTAFRELAVEHTIDAASKRRGGDLGYLRQDQKDVDPAVIKAAFDMKKTGEVAGPVAVGDKFYILKQTGKKRGIAKDFKEIEPGLRNELFRKKRSQAQRSFIDGLRAKAKIELNEENLAKIRIDLSKPTESMEKDGHGH